MVYGIPKERVWLFWDAVAPLLEKPIAVANDGTTLEEIRGRIDSGEAMLWVAVEGNDLQMAFVLTIEHESLYGWLLGGHSLDRWLEDTTQAMLRYARESGLRDVKATVRPGLARHMKKLGWKSSAIVMRQKAA